MKKYLVIMLILGTISFATTPTYANDLGTGAASSVGTYRIFGLRRANLGRMQLGERIRNWWQNRRFRPFQRLRNARAQRLATLTAHGQELNMMQSVGSEQFMLVPEETPPIPIQIITPEVSATLYEVPDPIIMMPPQPSSFALIETATVEMPVFQLISSPLMVAESTSVSQKLRNMRQLRRASGNPDAILLVKH